MSTDQSVADGRVISIHYELKLDDGQVIDTSAGRPPLDYLHGAGNIVPGLENALTGKALGEKLDVKVSPDQGYGMRDPAAVHTVERAAFPADAQLEAGLTFQAMDEDQNPLMGTITAVNGDEITVDFNHPLAGHDLHFAVEITAIRDATAEEQANGHVQGAGEEDAG